MKLYVLFQKNKPTVYLLSVCRFNKNDILETAAGTKIKISKAPKRSPLKLILQFITFGIYKAPCPRSPYKYKCKILKDET